MTAHLLRSQIQGCCVDIQRHGQLGPRIPQGSPEPFPTPSLITEIIRRSTVYRSLCCRGWTGFSEKSGIKCHLWNTLLAEIQLANLQTTLRGPFMLIGQCQFHFLDYPVIQMIILHCFYGVWGFIVLLYITIVT